MEFDDKNKRNLIEKYKAYHNKALKELRDTKLSPDQGYAVGQYVLDWIMKKAFDKADSTEEERATFKAKFKQLLHEECPEQMFETPLVYRPHIGFFKKKEG